MLFFRIIFVFLICLNLTYAQTTEKRKLKGPSIGLDDEKQDSSKKPWVFDDPFFKGMGHTFKEMEDFQKKFQDLMNQSFIEQFNQMNQRGIKNTNVGDIKRYEDNKFYYVEIIKSDLSESNYKVEVDKNHLIIKSDQVKKIENTDSKGFKSIQTTKSSIVRSYPLVDYVDPKSYDLKDKKDRLIIKFKKIKNVNKRKKVQGKKEDFI